MRRQGLCIYRGIPYAEPPVGTLRWRPPVAASRWEGVREAIAPRPACAQLPRRGGSIYASELPATDEDCLYLDIWAPDDARGLPVFVWIHGGSFIWGAGSEPLYEQTYRYQTSHASKRLGVNFCQLRGMAHFI